MSKLNSQLNEQSIPLLSETHFATWSQKIQKPNPPNLIIYIEGHTDDVGDSDYNMQLSQKRVQAVADYIKSKGFNESNIKISWHGKSQPETRKIAISKKLKDIRYANRRVTIRIEKL